MRPYLAKTDHKKRADRVVQGVFPEFKPQYPTPPEKKNWECSSVMGCLPSHVRPWVQSSALKKTYAIYIYILVDFFFRAILS
jgi:hypothetical protein